jgi:hypothetical protein
VEQEGVDMDDIMELVEEAMENDECVLEDGGKKELLNVDE